MQAFILGAGLGTRLAPLTHILPKPLMPVFQKPLIQHTMDHYIRCGVTEFMVNISCLPLMWERAFPEPAYRGCPISFSEEETPLDSGGGAAGRAQAPRQYGDPGLAKCGWQAQRGL